jgi:hypothetical protein
MRINKNASRAGLVALAICSAFLTACDKEAATAAAASGTPAPTASPARDTANAQAKAKNTYIGTYNRLIDDNRSLAAIFKSYQRLQVQSKSPNATSFYGDPATFDALFKTLKEARTAGSGDARLDAAVDRLLASGDKLVSVWTPLHPYYYAKGFLADNYVKARAEDANMTAAFTGALTDIHLFGQELDRIENDKRSERMAELKKKGEMASYYSLETMALAKKFIDTLQSTEGGKNQEAVARANTLTAELEASMENYRKAIAAQPADDSENAQKAAKANVNVQAKLQSMIGQWRIYSTSRSPSAMTGNSIVGYYNDAVNASSR